MYVCMYIMHPCFTCIDVSLMTRIINRVGKGITTTHGAGRSTDGACDLHRQIWKNIAQAKKLSEVAQPSVTQPYQRSPNLPIVVTQPTYCGPPTYLMWSPNLHNKTWSPNLHSKMWSLNLPKEAAQLATQVWSPNRV